MTRDDIIRMAQEADDYADRLLGKGEFHPDKHDVRDDHFAALHEQYLISQGYRKCAEGQRTTQWCGLLEDAVKAEREKHEKEIERYRLSAAMWRNEAYKLGGTPLPWDADELIEKAVAAEREACAKVAEDGLIGHTIAKAIRARGNK
jgi:hypothetical protein